VYTKGQEPEGDEFDVLLCRLIDEEYTGTPSTERAGWWCT